MVTLTISKETLVHFRCSHCNGWWSVGDAPKREYWFCTWCGKASQSPKEHMPEHPSGEGQWYKEWVTRQPIEGVGQITEIKERPDLIIEDKS